MGIAKKLKNICKRRLMIATLMTALALRPKMPKKVIYAHSFTPILLILIGIEETTLAKKITDR
ncbi:MAG: hypothetical protein ACD_7C00573G0001 [uncultured bacterium]|nr:MAG: hypothetical protein ACD_7C00573G0001 [uncultured bacterium]